MAKGVFCPVLTPFDENLSPDTGRLIAHCRRLLDEGCHGLAIFGTTSEANSLSVDERIACLDAVIGAGIPADRLMPGTGCCALSDTVRLTAHAVANGCAGVLMLPPFYYKAVADDGLFQAFRQVIDRVADDALKVYLYHIPPVATVGFSHDLVERLVTAYPNTVVGLKDSSGDWNYTKTLLERIPGFEVFSGTEIFLLDNLRAGGAGTISATVNVSAPTIRHLYDHSETADADALQQAVTRRRKLIQAYPTVPGLKAIVAHYGGDGDWARVRPPLEALDEASAAKLIASLDADGYRNEAVAAE